MTERPRRVKLFDPASLADSPDARAQAGIPATPEPKRDASAKNEALRAKAPKARDPRPTSSWAEAQAATRRDPRVDRLTGGLGTVAFVVLATLAISGGLATLRSDAQTASWPTVTGTITSSEIETERDMDRRIMHSIRLRYAYEVDGRRYTWAQIQHNATTHFRDEAEAKRFLAAYPVGQQVPVYVNPGNPQDALLRPGKTVAGPAMIVLGGFFAVMGLIFGVKTALIRPR